jgi:acyl dehydratase
MEDLSIGQKFNAGPVTVTEKAIIAFGNQFDPQDFHTDPVKAKKTLFGELVASGWHTAAMTMRMIVEATPKMKGGLIGRQVEKIGWPRPVRPGDQLSLEIEVMELRPSATNPARSTMRAKNTVFNQKGEVVMEMETIVFVPRKAAIIP